MAEPAADSIGAAADAFFGGRLLLRQPARGHRAGTDALLLAAAAPLDFDGLALDVGAGVGAAGLALASLRPKARIGLVEIDPPTAALARENLVLNGMAERGQVFEADALAPPRRRAAGLADESAALIISNPPFLDPRRALMSPDEDRRRAHAMHVPGAGEPSALAAWIAACLALVRPGGEMILIHRPDALGAILNSLEGRAGAVTILPVHARRETLAIRILVRAKKGSRAPLAIAPGLVLHEGERFTAAAEAIHRGEAAIAWQAAIADGFSR
jgi:tRNA1(Val) A37 N6-methylase TrmN6